jgi:hypothetical protein
MCEAESTGGALSLRAVGGESTHLMWLFFMQKATRYVDICRWLFAGSLTIIRQATVPFFSCSRLMRAALSRLYQPGIFEASKIEFPFRRQT